MGSKKPTTAFTLSFIAGILILINGAVLGPLSIFLTKTIQEYIPMEIMTWEVKAGLTIASTILYALMIPGIFMGIIVIVSSLFLYRSNVHVGFWGIVILLVSILSFTIGGGFVIGALLGIAGGIIALTWKPSSRK
jgi:hypothetical protein